MSHVLLQIKNLTKTFGSNGVASQVLKGVDFNIQRGDFTAIQGPSGCGKSTLLSILGLLDTASSGEYLLCGQNVDTLSSYQKSALRNGEIGWIFQNFNLIGDMTALENVCLPLRYDPAIKKADYKAVAMAVLNDVDMVKQADLYPNQLSGGQQQRVAIARALITQPSLLLADEPTGNLDSENAELIFALLQKIHAQGATIVMVTHDNALALRCQQQIQLKDGQIVHQGA